MGDRIRSVEWNRITQEDRCRVRSCPERPGLAGPDLREGVRVGGYLSADAREVPELLLPGDDRTPYSGLLLLSREQEVSIEAGGSRVYSLEIEIRQFVGEGVRAFVPDVIVRPAASMGWRSSSADTMRQAWTEDRFMTVLDEKAGAEVVGVARSILDWGVRHATRFWWGEGKKDGSFGPVFSWKGTDYYPVFVWSTGVGKIQFQWLKLRPPFDSIERRRELLDRLNAIPGIALPEDALGGRPSFPLRALVPAEARKRFLAVLDWVVDEVKANV